MNDPCAVVLAAGKGTRMKRDLPKVLCHVVGRPMIHFVIDALEKAGIGRQIVVVGVLAHRLHGRQDRDPLVSRPRGPLPAGVATRAAAPSSRPWRI